MRGTGRRHHEIAKPLRGPRARFFQRLLRVALVNSSVLVSLVKRSDLRTVGLRSERRRSLVVRRSPHRLAPSGSQKANHRKALVSYYFPLLFGSDWGGVASYLVARLGLRGGKKRKACALSG
ncbi:hypothetical protein TRVL_10411 [Trypanosoma vivax]|nr:hypothetical protein TRVL_10411 [Trypanosoma vivax]